MWWVFLCAKTQTLICETRVCRPALVDLRPHRLWPSRLISNRGGSDMALRDFVDWEIHPRFRLRYPAPETGSSDHDHCG